jgi:hypothetical protein
MGACYSIRLKVKLTDEQGAIHALNEKISTGAKESIRFNIKELGADTGTFDGLMKVFLAGWPENQFQKNVEDGFLIYTNDFNAMYSWEQVMAEMFETIAPYLADGSEFYSNPDNWWETAKIKNGKIKWTQKR